MDLYFTLKDGQNPKSPDQGTDDEKCQLLLQDFDSVGFQREKHKILDTSFCQSAF
jgi:hypothetical protein